MFSNGRQEIYFELGWKLITFTESSVSQFSHLLDRKKLIFYLINMIKGYK